MIKIYVSAGFLAVLIAIVCLGTHCGSSHEDGYAVGTLINVHNEGVIFARPAVTLLHTGEMKGQEFSMDQGLFDKARELADRSARVRVEYAERYLCFRWNYASCNIITKIEEDPAVPVGAEKK